MLGRAWKEYLPLEVTAGSWATPANTRCVEHVYDPLGREILTRKPLPDGSGTCASTVTYSLDTVNGWRREIVQDEA